VITFGESVLLAFERAVDFVVIELAEVAVRATIAAAMVVAGYGIVAVSAVILACRILTATGIVLAIRRTGTALALAGDREKLRELARQVPIVGAIPIVNALYWRADTLLLTWLRGLADVGFYGAATRILDVTRSCRRHTRARFIRNWRGCTRRTRDNFARSAGNPSRGWSRDDSPVARDLGARRHHHHRSLRCRRRARSPRRSP
jgi:hypothetical protein